MTRVSSELPKYPSYPDRSAQRHVSAPRRDDIGAQILRSDKQDPRHAERLAEQIGGQGAVGADPDCGSDVFVPVANLRAF